MRGHAHVPLYRYNLSNNNNNANISFSIAYLIDLHYICTCAQLDNRKPHTNKLLSAISKQYVITIIVKYVKWFVL